MRDHKTTEQQYKIYNNTRGQRNSWTLSKSGPNNPQRFLPPFLFCWAYGVKFTWINPPPPDYKMSKHFFKGRRLLTAMHFFSIYLLGYSHCICKPNSTKCTINMSVYQTYFTDDVEKIYEITEYKLYFYGNNLSYIH